MKKVFFILVLLPLFSFSQTLVKDVSRISFLILSTNFHKTTEVFDMTVYIEDNYLVMKSKVETTEYKIVKVSLDEYNDTIYEIIIDKKPHTASLFTYQESSGLLIYSKNKDEKTIIYERKVGTN